MYLSAVGIFVLIKLTTVLSGPVDPVKPFEDILFRYLRLTSIEPLLVLKYSIILLLIEMTSVIIRIIQLLYRILGHGAKEVKQEAKKKKKE